jgi:hypothetical protein
MVGAQVIGTQVVEPAAVPARPAPGAGRGNPARGGAQASPASGPGFISSKWYRHSGRPMCPGERPPG